MYIGRTPPGRTRENNKEGGPRQTCERTPEGIRSMEEDNRKDRRASSRAHSRSIDTSVNSNCPFEKPENKGVSIQTSERSVVDMSETSARGSRSGSRSAARRNRVTMSVTRARGTEVGLCVALRHVPQVAEVDLGPVERWPRRGGGLLRPSILGELLRLLLRHCMNPRAVSHPPIRPKHATSETHPRRSMAGTARFRVASGHCLREPFQRLRRHRRLHGPRTDHCPPAQGRATVAAALGRLRMMVCS